MITGYKPAVRETGPLTASRAVKVFNYEPLTGVLLWRISKGIDSIFGLWRARIQINGLPVYLGLFEERPAAIAAYRAAALKLHGDFARV